MQTNQNQNQNEQWKLLVLLLKEIAESKGVTQNQCIFITIHTIM